MDEEIGIGHTSLPVSVRERLPAHASHLWHLISVRSLVNIYLPPTPIVLSGFEPLIRMTKYVYSGSLSG
jgi:hypothetical protein